MWRHACNRKRTLARRRGVFVRGAGFTRAVCAEALLENDFEVQWLLERFRSYRTARKLLELEVASNPGGAINQERLMTRLLGECRTMRVCGQPRSCLGGRVAQQ